MNFTLRVNSICQVFFYAFLPDCVEFTQSGFSFIAVNYSDCDFEKRKSKIGGFIK